MTMIPSTTFDLEVPQLDWAGAWLLEYGKNTREAYASDLKRFFGFCAALGQVPQNATRALCAAFSRHESEIASQSASTVSRRLSAISAYFSYGCAEGYIESNPMASVRRPRVSRESVSTGLDKTEFSCMLTYAKADCIQTYTLFLLLGMNGLRISEALNADFADLGSERGHVTLKVRRKGGKESAIPLNPITAGALARHSVGRDDGPIFTNSKGERMSRQGAWGLVRRIARKAIPDKAEAIHPHSFRHSFATLTLDAGAPLHVVQDAMAHADPRTTQLYNRARNNMDNHPTYLLGGE